MLTPAQIRKVSRDRFSKARRAEIAYQRQLSEIGRHVGKLIRGFAPNGEIRNWPILRDALTQYSVMLRPFAEAVTERMHAEVSQRDFKAWTELSQEMGRSLRAEIRNAPTGAAMREALELQVGLITSLPIEAAERVHKLTLEGITQGRRSEGIAQEIMRSGEVTVSRARTIARTEVSRTATLLTMSRAEYAGSTHYIWRTSKDAQVRPLHRALNGKTFAWNDPPVTGENGERSLPGAIFNCRCFASPILPD